ncbi:MAG: tetratricopeptide repeat protein [Opitutales bacterium]|jgi:tetratricopeptide (TPR) repeat protein|nr:tetratricopeptide repeat protein [Opitutales bacterium]MDP4643129.1 tetratricopeptide repeat protein [Opitutales bacterium]MDP4776324.1 tetratricopeptide repeat protein [Opitutales bacterium]MDP4884703.1 tetratricopeptide repeat protein [Opitutales bacterium]MDP5080704.1 tetratricopeptide repeat protein [Opitutales bacterium]
MLRCFLIYIALCCLPLALFGASKGDAARIDLYYGIAEGNFFIGDLAGATSGVEQMLRIDAAHVPALTLLARIQLKQGATDNALATAEQTIALEPAELEHQLLKALVLGQMNRSDEAIALIESVLKKAPEQSDDYRAANQLLGLLQMAQGNWDAAADSFHAIYLADPTTASTSLKLSSEAYLEKARIALEKANQDEAIQSIDQAISVYEGKSGQEALKERTSLTLMRARLLSQLGQHDAAIAGLQTLTAQQPNNLEATVTLASIYASANRWTSLDTLIPQIAHIPELADITLYFEGRSALSKGRVGTARAKFEAAIDLKREGQLLSSLHFYRGHCLDALKRKEEASTEIIKALNTGFRPETTAEGALASRILIQSKQAERAIPILEAITLNQIDTSPEVWALLGRAHIAEQTPALAISAYNEAINISPTDPELRATRGSLLRNIGDIHGAAVDYYSARQSAPDNPAYAYAFGLTLFQLGQLDEAEKHLNFAAEMLPENSSLQLLHALLAYSVNKNDVSKEALQTYFLFVGDTPNESALYLEYALKAQEDISLAILGLNQRIIDRERSDFLQHFIRYNVGKLDRKAIIDHAGIAESKEIAQQQICEAAFWIAQHERAAGNRKAYTELLNLIVETGHADIPEYQFARWQLLQIKP